MRRSFLAPALAALLLSSCGAGTDWGAADVFYTTLDGDEVVLMGVDIDSPIPSVVRVAELGPASDITAARVAYGPNEPLVLVSKPDGSTAARTITAATQTLAEARPVTEYGTVARIAEGLATTTPEVAGPVRVRLQLNTREDSFDAGPIAIHPSAITGTKEHLAVVGSTSEAGTVMQIVNGIGEVEDPIVVAANALPGQAAMHGATVAVALNRSIPKGANTNAKATLPPDNRLVLVTPGQPTRFVRVGDSPNHVLAVGAGRFAVDGTVEGRRVVSLVSPDGKVTVLAKLTEATPVLGLAFVDDRLIALQTNTVNVIALPSSTSAASPLTTVELPSESYSDWVVTS